MDFKAVASAAELGLEHAEQGYGWIWLLRTDGGGHVDLAIAPQLVDFAVGQRVLVPEPPAGTYQGLSLLSVSPTRIWRTLLEWGVLVTPSQAQAGLKIETPVFQVAPSVVGVQTWIEVGPDGVELHRAGSNDSNGSNSDSSQGGPYRVRPTVHRDSVEVGVTLPDGGRRSGSGVGEVLPEQPTWIDSTMDTESNSTRAKARPRCARSVTDREARGLLTHVTRTANSA